MTVISLFARLTLLAWPGITLAAADATALDCPGAPAGSVVALWTSGALLLVSLAALLLQQRRHRQQTTHIGVPRVTAGAAVQRELQLWQTAALADRARVEHLEQLLAQRQADLDDSLRQRQSLLDQATLLGQTNERLARTIQQAEAASRAKAEFLASMSHEIRTPVSAILNLGQQLQCQPLLPAQADLVGKMDAAGRKLLDRVDELLDCSGVEALVEIDATAPTLTAPTDQVRRVQRAPGAPAGHDRMRRMQGTRPLPLDDHGFEHEAAHEMAPASADAPALITHQQREPRDQHHYLRRFAHEYDDVVARLRTLPGAEARMLLHRLIGTSASLGLNLVTAHARACRAVLEAGDEQTHIGATTDGFDPWAALQNALEQALSELTTTDATSDSADSAGLSGKTGPAPNDAQRD